MVKSKFATPPPEKIDVVGVAEVDIRVKECEFEIFADSVGAMINEEVKLRSYQ